MVGLARTQADLTIFQAELSRSMVDMDYSQVGLPRFQVQNEMNQPPQEEMSNLEAPMDELKRVC